jgi:acylphosphatase
MALLRWSKPAVRCFPSRKRTDCGTLAWVITVNRKRMQVLYSGQVQGVGFRYTVKSVATGFDVTGSVRNLAGGGVELVVEGAKDELEAFRKAIRESGLDHFIRQEDVSWQDAKSEFRGFEIVR